MMKEYLWILNTIIGKDIKLLYFQKIRWMIKISRLNKPMIIANEKWTKEKKKLELKKIKLIFNK
jgi:hypothetical protein